MPVDVEVAAGVALVEQCAEGRDGARRGITISERRSVFVVRPSPKEPSDNADRRLGCTA